MGNMGYIFSSEKAQVPDKEGKMVENCSNNKASKESRKYSREAECTLHHR